MILRSVVCLLAAVAATAGSGGTRSIGWWWHPPASASDPSVDAVLVWAAAHADIASVVMLHCGVLTCCRTGCGECGLPKNASECAAKRGTCENNAGVGGTVSGNLSDSCARAIPALNALGIRTELWLGEDDSLSSARYLFSHADETAASLLAVAAHARQGFGGNISGFNIDLEARGGNVSTDGAASASFLARATALLGARGQRFSADVNCGGTHPISSDCATLGASGHIMDMGTYNADSYEEWYYSKLAPALAAAAPLPPGALGVGLACYNDSKNVGTWSVTPQAAEERVCMLMNRSVAEIDMFAISQGKRDSFANWPPAFWVGLPSLLSPPCSSPSPLAPRPSLPVLFSSRRSSRCDGSWAGAGATRRCHRQSRARTRGGTRAARQGRAAASHRAAATPASTATKRAPRPSATRRTCDGCQSTQACTRTSAARPSNPPVACSI